MTVACLPSLEVFNLASGNPGVNNMHCICSSLQSEYTVHKDHVLDELSTRLFCTIQSQMLTKVPSSRQYCQKISCNFESSFIARSQLVFIKSIKSNPKPPAPFPVAADLFAASFANILDKVFFRDFARFLAAAFVDDVAGGAAEISVVMDRCKSPAAAGMDLDAEAARGFDKVLVCVVGPCPDISDVALSWLTAAGFFGSE